jgi:hypothetical protein
MNFTKNETSKLIYEFIVLFYFDPVQEVMHPKYFANCTMEIRQAEDDDSGPLAFREVEHRLEINSTYCVKRTLKTE